MTVTFKTANLYGELISHQETTFLTNTGITSMQPPLKKQLEDIQKAHTPPGKLLATNAVLGYGERLEGSSQIIQGIGTMGKYGYQNGVTALVLGPSYLMQCCGSSPITNLSTEFNGEKELQGFVCQLFRSVCFTQTYYFIAATYQITDAKAAPFGNAYSVLVALGAKEVDSSPNRNHGPNDMHLHVWSPTRTDDRWTKYLDIERSRTKYGDIEYNANPRWFAALSASEQAKVIQEREPLQVAFDTWHTKQLEINKKAKLDQRMWDAFYLIRNGKMKNRLAQHGLKVVDKNGNEIVEPGVQATPAARPAPSTGRYA
jgi:hypothetical protein